MLLDASIKSTLRDAAWKLTGYRKRDFMARVVEDYLQGSARKAERVLGWKRQSVQLQQFQIQNIRRSQPWEESWEHLKA